jgi:uncharacterized ferritin-like protein (DUF455 family)
MNARQSALDILTLKDPISKTQQTRALFDQLNLYAIEPADILRDPGDLPGRPAKPALVAMCKAASRSLTTTAGQACLLHAIAHIEFNAINLALDAVFRFAHMPEKFYTDWLSVASEEALHFSLLCEQLQRLGYRYGDFQAHDGLWQMAERTAGDVLARMALVPRTLEARGLDATPALQAKFSQVGQTEVVEVLSLILRDEIGHVAIGNHWYRWLCQGQGLEPIAHYQILSRQYVAPRLRPPFNWAAREAAGFTPQELQFLRTSQ